MSSVASNRVRGFQPGSSTDTNCAVEPQTDLFTPTLFACFLRFWAPKYTNQYNKTTHMRKSRFFNKCCPF